MRSSLICLSSLLTLPVLAQDFSSERLIHESMLNRPKDIITGDIDGDGDLDIIVGITGRIAAYVNDGTASFGPQQFLVTANRPEEIHLLDLDLDGDLDLTWANYATPSMAWSENLGGGVFGPTQQLAEGVNGCTSMAWADINEDGSLDFWAAMSQSDAIVLYLNAGDQTFIEEVGRMADNPWRCAVGDMNNDGHWDVVAAGRNVTWWKDPAHEEDNGPYLNEIDNTVEDARGLVLQDWDDDGDLDIRVADEAGDRFMGFTNYGDETFSAGGSAEDQLGAMDLDLMYLDEDPISDVIMSCSGAVPLRIESTGSLGTILFYGFTNVRASCSGDLDGDGRTDVVTLSEERDEIAVHLQVQPGQFATPFRLEPHPGGLLVELQTLDVDEDGLRDVLTLFSGTHLLAWSRNLGGGMFAPVEALHQFPSDLGNAAMRILPADLDADLDQDLVVSFRTDSLVWLRQDGDGTYEQGGSIGKLVPRQNVVTADFDGDGDIDVVASDPDASSANRLKLFRNDGSGTFAPFQAVNDSPLGSVASLSTLDQDQDGDMDLVWYQNGTGIRMLLNNGDASFTGQSTISTFNGGTDIQVGDLNGDALPDLAAGSLGVLINGGDGTFSTTSVPYPVDLPYVELAIADLDSDGYPDIVGSSVQTSDGAAHWHRNDGTGAFGAAQRIDVAFGHASELACGDLDLDGDPDVVMGSSINDRVHWCENFIGSMFQAQGRVYVDVDGDQTWDEDEPPFAYHSITCSPSASIPYTNAAGEYSFRTNAGTYAIRAASMLGFWQTEPFEHIADLTVLDPVAWGLDFAAQGLVDTLSVDVASGTGVVRCSQPFPRWVDITNFGTSVADVTVHLYLDAAEEVLSVSPGPTLVEDLHYQWEFPGLGLFEQRHILLESRLPNLPPGEVIIDSLHVIAHADDGTVTWSQQHTRPVLCSFDPNDKQVFPVGFGEYGALDIATEELQYTVRFQNTGNDTAFTVVLRDRLHDALDPASIRMIGSSHAITSMIVEPNGELVLTFENILLPDSTTDLIGSQGYVVFAIRLEPGLTSGSAITNSVDIHFGQNAPVSTNTVLTTLIDCGLHSPSISLVDGFLLRASEGIAYQWFLDEEPIPGADHRDLLPSIPGAYTVEVLSAYGCRAISEAYDVITTGVGDNERPRIVVLPNPVSSSARIILDTPLPRAAILLLIDASGRTVRKLSSNGTRELVLDRVDLADGPYVLRIVGENAPALTARIVLTR